MADNPKNNLSTVPPSVTKGASGKATREPGPRLALSKVHL